MTKRTCSIDGCGQNVHGRGWCHMHYQRWSNHGDPLLLIPVRTTEERFWAKVDHEGPDGTHSQTGENLGPCWLWTASTTAGYGYFGVDGRMVFAHRFAYELLVGPIPPGLQLDHLCRVPLCVRPAHLEPVTSRENTLRGDGPAAMRAAKTHCLSGHPFSPENTYLRKGGGRACRACGSASKYLARKKAS